VKTDPAPPPSTAPPPPAGFRDEELAATIRDTAAVLEGACSSMLELVSEVDRVEGRVNGIASDHVKALGDVHKQIADMNQKIDQVLGHVSSINTGLSVRNEKDNRRFARNDEQHVEIRERQGETDVEVIRLGAEVGRIKKHLGIEAPTNGTAS
jgi:TolA-binding protein